MWKSPHKDRGSPSLLLTLLPFPGWEQSGVLLRLSSPVLSPPILESNLPGHDKMSS